MERRLAAVLAFDMVGYSRLIGVDEQGTLATFRRHRGNIFNPQSCPISRPDRQASRAMAR